jgi:hypothetical protein
MAGFLLFHLMICKDKFECSNSLPGRQHPKASASLPNLRCIRPEEKNLKTIYSVAGGSTYTTKLHTI